MKMLKYFQNHLTAQMLKKFWHWHYITAALLYFVTAVTHAEMLTNFIDVMPTVPVPSTPSTSSLSPTQLSTTQTLSTISLTTISTPSMPLISTTHTFDTQYLNGLRTKELSSASSSSSSFASSSPSSSSLMAVNLKSLTKASASSLLKSHHSSFYVMVDEPSFGQPAVAALTASDTYIPASAVTSTFIEPYLDGVTSTNITAQIGTHAYLPCRVKQVGNKSISWIRIRDGHILTVDRAVFIADQRFLALKQPNKFWTLQIKYVQARDAGAYECQVSTEPKVSARVHLQVVVPRTEILGDPDRYVKSGSTVILRCIVRGALEPPTFIMWYHGIEQLTADSKRHKITVERNLPEIEGDAHSTIGSLIIESAKKRDTGNYTCNPSNSPSVTVTLNVINGESSASAVTSSASVTRKFYSTYSHALIFSIIIIVGHKT